MKKIAMASVATLGLLGAAAVPAFGETSSVSQTQQLSASSAAANVHCKVRHWAQRWGRRDAFRGDGHLGRKGRFGHGHKRDEWRDNVDFEDRDRHVKDEDEDVSEENSKPGRWDKKGKHGHHDKKDFVDVEATGHRDHRGHGRKDDVFFERGIGRIHHRWNEKRRWGTEKWCRGKPVRGVQAGGGWRAKHK